MSLGGFSSYEEYLSAALELLKSYQWIFRHKNTDILTENVLTNFPPHWTEYFNQLSTDDLHRIILGETRGDTPEDLKEFFETIRSLSLESDKGGGSPSDCPRISGLSRKKAHEIALLAPVIHEICESTGCDLIVDVGSGIGHLPHLLHDKYNYPILALEASKKLVETAQMHQSKLHPKSKANVIFREFYVTESSAQSIENLVKTHFGPDKKICLTGLHACADLTVEVLKLFEKLQNGHAMVIMPCCYHRMTDDVNYFKCFPCSAICKQLFDKYDSSKFIGRPFLRLACQQTVRSYVTMSREEHERRGRLCMQRALLQLVAEMENCSVRRLKRKSGKSDATDSDEGFEAYLNNLPRTHRLVRRDDGQPTDYHRQQQLFSIKMREKWNEKHKNDCWAAEVLTGLQAAIQSVCENVILLDRVAFLKEMGIHCCTRKITNDSISPRCWALIALKNVRVQ
ncbi:methyltransferase-like protein 25B [Anthonomus grandis grandis]|uniref:methyltransferase-like protein 25B n=1 Tax=Anthonomus grandis grandis TaxID=2921223 RepID=UPI002165F1FF|nr:methyltransferase-like protein 25B [Anthonomus grandis grandis]